VKAAPKKHAGGRPRAAAEARGAIFSIRLTADERAAVERAAEAAGVKASEWARGVILAASERAVGLPVTVHPVV